MKLKPNYSILSFGLTTAATSLAQPQVGSRTATLSAIGHGRLRVAMVSASFAICLAAIWAYYSRQTKYRKVWQRYLDLLCRLDANDVTGNLADVLPTLSEDNPWQSVLLARSRLHPNV